MNTLLIRRFSSRFGASAAETSVKFPTASKSTARGGGSVFALVALLSSGFAYFGWPDDQNGNFIVKPAIYYERAKRRITTYKEPAAGKKLLPDMEQLQKQNNNYYPKYTLIINLNDLLVRSEWSPEYGWRVAKNPDVNMFLQHLAAYYEIVIFTGTPWVSAEPIIKNLATSSGAIQFALAREMMRYENGSTYKDLEFLNRDLSKVLVIDVDSEVYTEKGKENLILVPKWDGMIQSTVLPKYMAFLETVALSNTQDIRNVIKSFVGKDIPSEFRRRQIEYRAAKLENFAPKNSILNLWGWGVPLEQQMESFEQRKKKLIQDIEIDVDLYPERIRRAYEANLPALKAQVDQIQKEREDGEKKMVEHLRKPTTLWDYWIRLGLHSFVSPEEAAHYS